jgi:hypothetical protein
MGSCRLLGSFALFGILQCVLLTGVWFEQLV